MKISLIIPAYNEEKYLGACLDSVKKNAEGIYEIIVVDNASDDRTAEVAGRKNVKVVREDRKGLTRARQKGFTEATGDILVYIDADTRVPAGWYKRLVSEFKNNSELVCLSGPYLYYDLPRLHRTLVFAYYLLGILCYWFTRYMILGGNFAIRRDTLEKMGGFDTSIEFYGEDSNIARRAHQFGKVKFTLRFPIYSSARRFHGQGLVKTGTLYILNFFSEVFIHKPITNDYLDIR